MSTVVATAVLFTSGTASADITGVLEDGEATVIGRGDEPGSGSNGTPSTLTKVVVMCADGTGDCDPQCPDGIWTAIWQGPPTNQPGQPGWRLTHRHCGTPAPTDTTPTLTLTDFQNLPLPPSPWTIQPPGQRVLVGMPTIVYTTTTDPTILTTTILNQPITVRATPTAWTWNFGDTTPTLTTTHPGAPYPQLINTHTYTTRGTFTITLTTTYRGEYALTGGPWQPIPGRAHVISPTTTTVQAVAGRPHLVADPLTSG